MVTCRECGVEKKALEGHIRMKHPGMSIQDYRDKYGQDVDIGWTIKDVSKSDIQKGIASKKGKKALRTTLSPDQIMISSLSASEQKTFNDQFDLLFQQASRDPVLSPMIRDIVMNQIFIARYQQQIQALSSKFSSGMDAKTVVELHKLVQTMQETNLKNLDSLNLTKAKKDALNKTPESTPSKMVAAFYQAVRQMTPEERAKNKEDMETAMRRLRYNREELLSLIDISEGAVAEDIEPVATE